MMVKSIHISNFKSFKDARIENLGLFNVVIGTNAAGKSNFIQVFRFLRDVADHGLRNAVSLQGGRDYVVNSRLAAAKPLRLRISYGANLEMKRKDISVLVDEVVYEFAVKFDKKGLGFTILEDSLTSHLKFSRPAGKKKTCGGRPLGEGKGFLFNRQGRIDYRLELPAEVSLTSEDLVPQFLKDERLPTDALLLETPFFEVIHNFEKFFSRMAIYDFDPRLPKKAAVMTGKRELEEDAGNLVLVLRDIFSDREKRRKFDNLLKGCLPFVEDVDVKKLGDGSLIFKLKEVYARDSFIPATFISDGTINLTALIVALYFEDKSLLIIEEPEKNVHPYLIGKVVDMMKDAAKRKQIIVTTHNAEIVKCAELENVILVSRDRNGFSVISRPAERKEVQVFLKNEVGIEDLFAQNLLGQNDDAP
jgi:predicted ATPase